MSDLLRSSYPQTAGTTLAAVQAMAGQETFDRRQVAYLISVALTAGASARSAGDDAEVRAAAEARFEPRLTRSERIARRMAEAEQRAEIYWLRRTGEAHPVWAGGDAAQAEAQFMWDDDRPDYVSPGISVRVVNTRNGLVWRDEAVGPA